MPVDIAADVIENRPSSDRNVIRLSARRSRQRRPGNSMVKAAAGMIRRCAARFPC
jgi:hypothetical protein